MIDGILSIFLMANAALRGAEFFAAGSPSGAWLGYLPSSSIKRCFLYAMPPLTKYPALPIIRKLYLKNTIKLYPIT